MKKIQLSILFLILFASISIAQPYDFSVGVRAGYSSGLNMKMFMNDDFAIDAQGLYNKSGFLLNVLYEYQFSPYPKERLQYYFGAGPHSGNWDGEFALGVAIMLGCEYIFRQAPVTIGLEWKPMMNLYKQFDYVIPDIGLTFRVILN
jgi:hypothetical protein